MMQAVGKYLKNQGYTNVFIDNHPEAMDSFIALYCWGNEPAPLHDGTSTRLIQVRVRRPTAKYAEAMRVCTEIVTLLDSGDNERLIPLDHPGAVIGRIRRLPIVLERQEKNVTVYAEIALWGKL